MRNSFRNALTLCFLATLALASRQAGASEAEAYSLEQNAPEIAVGVPGKASLTVVGRNGWHVNADAPITLSLMAEPGITLSKAKMTRGDLAESSKERARFEVGFTSATAGKKKITAEARFVMCQEQACKPVKETVTLAVAVAEPKANPTTAPARPARKTERPTSTKGPAAKPPHAAAEKSSW